MHRKVSMNILDGQASVIRMCVTDETPEVNI